MEMSTPPTLTAQFTFTFETKTTITHAVCWMFIYNPEYAVVWAFILLRRTVIRRVYDRRDML